jgi:uncharacterized protein (DUF2147 family)
MFNRKALVVLSIIMILVTACGGRSTPTPTGEPVPLPDTVPMQAAADVTGDWTGNLSDLTNGGTCTMELTLNQASDMTISGSVHFTCPVTNELYDVSGSFDGTTLHLQEVNNRYFTATLSGETLAGYVAWGVYDNPANAWGQFTLTRGGAGSTEGVVPPGETTTDPQGTWSGMMHFNDGSTFFVLAYLESQPDDNWNASFTWVEFSVGKFYRLSGTMDNGTLHLNGEDGVYSLTASIQGSDLTGYLANGCFDCPEQANGTFSLQRTVNNTLQPVFGSTSFDGSGTWNGTILFRRENDNMYNMIAILTQTPGSSDVSGQVILSNAAGSSETHQVTGQISSTYIFLDDTLTSTSPLYFWGNVSSHEIYGFLSTITYDTPENAMAIFYIYKQ